MNICVFDTETTSLNKPFTYNIGYIIYDTDTETILQEREYVVEQVWHNPMLFCTAYYADKRSIYVSDMRSRKIKMEKFGYITQRMCRDFEQFEVERAFAYNSDFDERVFDFNCDWFKCINPFDNVPISDIRGFAHHFIVDKYYKSFCDSNGYYTDSGNYSTTAEVMYRYLTYNTDFVESHTALSDSHIELVILQQAFDKGADINGDYKAKTTIEKVMTKTLSVLVNKEEVFSTDYEKIRISKDRTKISLTRMDE